MITRFIPNAVTLLNLLSGCIAVLLVVNDNFVGAAFFVFLGIFFDFFDGFLARKLNAQSALGIQLDSLADLITSGLVPGLIMYKLIAMSLNQKSYEFVSTEWNSFTDWNAFKVPWLAIIGFGITLGSAYRLARFNIDEDQQYYFKGLPVPANTLLILSLPLILHFHEYSQIHHIILNTWFLIGLTMLSCYLLNSNIKLFALKFKDYSFKHNVFKYLFVIISAVLLVILKFLAIPLIIVLYILASVLNKTLTT